MGYYYQERNTSHTILSVLVALFLVGVVIGLAFLGVEPLASAKNTVTGLLAAPPDGSPPDKVITAEIKQTPVPPVIEPPPSNPSAADIPQVSPTPNVVPQPPTQQSSPGVPISEKPPVISIPELEKQIHDLVNVERTKNSLAAVAWDDAVSAVARNHSEDMAKRNYFNHLSPEGQNAVDRCKLAGIVISKNPVGGVYYLGCSENIFYCTLVKVYWYDRNGVLARAEYYTMSEIAELAVQGWMKSQGHRENILKSYWRTEGIGIAISTSGDVYVTENFN